jgi:hypothetical protein
LQYGFGFLSVDVTGLAQGWVDGAFANGGVVLEEGDADRSNFRASDYASVSDRPKLEICYYPAE